MRRFLVATTVCGVVIAGATIGSAVVLAGLVARIITDPASRTIGALAAPITLLATLWIVRVLTQWQQGRLAQHGASDVIADLSDQVLRTATSAPPRELARRRDDAAAVITRGLDGLRVYFTAYLPSLFLAAILTPATVVVIAFVDWQAAAIVLVALPLVPIFMILIGLATEDRSAAALAAMTTLQARLLDLVAGLPTLRAFGRAEGRPRRSPNWVRRIAVRQWPRCASRSCPRWYSNCWPLSGWPWWQSASECDWCTATFRWRPR